MCSTSGRDGVWGSGFWVWGKIWGKIYFCVSALVSRFLFWEKNKLGQPPPFYVESKFFCVRKCPYVKFLFVKFICIDILFQRTNIDEFQISFCQIYMYRYSVACAWAGGNASRLLEINRIKSKQQNRRGRQRASNTEKRSSSRTKIVEQKKDNKI